MPNSYKAHTGVYAVILDAANENILLIRKTRGPYTGLLDLPGGTIEADELIEEALAREITEETACTLLSARQLETVSIRYEYRDPKTGEAGTWKHIGILYTARVAGEPSAAGDGLDSGGAMWVAVSTIKDDHVTPFVRMGLERALGGGQER